MGLFDSMKEKRAAQKEAVQKRLETEGKCLTYIGGEDGSVLFLRERGIEFKSKEESGFREWPQISSVTVEDASELESRVTATRLLLLGVFAFAAKKKTGGTKYVVVEGEDFLWAIEVARKKAPAANQFVMKSRALMKSAQ